MIIKRVVLRPSPLETTSALWLSSPMVRVSYPGISGYRRSKRPRNQIYAFIRLEEPEEKAGSAAFGVDPPRDLLMSEQHDQVVVPATASLTKRLERRFEVQRWYR